MVQDQVKASQCQGNKGEHARAKRIAHQVLLTPPLRMRQGESKERARSRSSILGVRGFFEMQDHRKSMKTNLL